MFLIDESILYVLIFMNQTGNTEKNLESIFVLIINVF